MRDSIVRFKSEITCRRWSNSAEVERVATETVGMATSTILSARWASLSRSIVSDDARTIRTLGVTSVGRVHGGMRRQ